MLTRNQLDKILGSRTHFIGMPLPDYQPQRYDSPIEERLAWSLSKVLDAQATLTPQYSLPTQHGFYRTDFILHSAGKNTVIECDGKEFHTDWEADTARTAALLESGLVDQVARYSGAALFLSADDAVYSLSLLHPEAFTGRAAEVAYRRAGSGRDGFAADYSERPQGGVYGLDIDLDGGAQLYGEDPDGGLYDYPDEDGVVPVWHQPRATHVSQIEVDRFECVNTRGPVGQMRLFMREHQTRSQAEVIALYRAAQSNQGSGSGW